MQLVAQDIDDILASLQPLTVDWQDDISRHVIGEIETMPVKKVYAAADVQAILDKNFDDGLLICRLFLGHSKDSFATALRTAVKDGRIGVTNYRANRSAFIDSLISIGLLEAMGEQTNRTPRWSDVLVERLRSGRGSAISGQRRGRGVEDFAETLISKVFGDQYASRCTFSGRPNKSAKCDFAIPSRTSPRVVVEAKGYGATGSKMTDVIGDIEKIIAAKRSDTAFLFFTDGLTWRQRKNDLRKIIQYQNAGDIMRVYTSAMAPQFETDLRQLKVECGL